MTPEIRRASIDGLRQTGPTRGATPRRRGRNALKDDRKKDLVASRSQLCHPEQRAKTLGSGPRWTEAITSMAGCRKALRTGQKRSLPICCSHLDCLNTWAFNAGGGLTVAGFSVTRRPSRPPGPASLRSEIAGRITRSACKWPWERGPSCTRSEPVIRNQTFGCRPLELARRLRVHYADQVRMCSSALVADRPSDAVHALSLFSADVLSWVATLCSGALTRASTVGSRDAPL